MDWIHCNNCASQPGDEKGRKFVTTNCGHIYCEKCLLLPELRQCRLCQSSYRTMPLSSNMTKEVEIYFRNPIEDIQKCVRVLEFQDNHRMRLTAIHREKLKSMEKENAFLKQEFKRLEKENQFMRDENKRLQDSLLEYKRKIECLMDRQLPQNTPIKSATRNDRDGFRNITPKIMKPVSDIISSATRRPVFNQSSENPNFFLMSSGKGTPNDPKIFNTPTVAKMPGSYRSVRTLASDLSSPATPTSTIREYLSQKDQSYKKVKLPGDKGVPSPSASAFRRLCLSKLSSISKKDNQSFSKYSQYFNKP